MSRFVVRVPDPGRLEPRRRRDARARRRSSASCSARPEVDAVRRRRRRLRRRRGEQRLRVRDDEGPARAPDTTRSSAAELSQAELMNVARQATSAIPGARVVIQDLSQRGFSAARGGGFPVEFNIRGPRLGRARGAPRARSWRRCGSRACVTDVDSDYQVGMPEVQVIPDRNKAADLGISMADDRRDGQRARSAASASASSRTRAAASTSACACWRRSASGPRTSRGSWCAPATAGSCAWATLVRIEQRPTLQAITRRDRERAITITANVAPGRLAGRGDRRARCEIAQARSCPTATARSLSGTARSLPRVVRLAVVRDGARA